MMLQFLQGKTFGNQKVPEGWVIVTAGNPPEYNKSVREFDVVTLDRIKRIDVQPDFEVWKEYAYEQGIHPAVISYLELRRKNFYRMENTVDGRIFATARGWEDLSRLIQVYETLDKEVDREVVYQYIQHPMIAKILPHIWHYTISIRQTMQWRICFRVNGHPSLWVRSAMLHWMSI